MKIFKSVFTLTILAGVLILVFLAFPTVEHYMSDQIHTDPLQDAQDILDDMGVPVTEVNPLQVLVFGNTTNTIDIAYDMSAHPVSYWYSGKDNEIVINAAYFLEDFTPAGYLVVDREIVSDRMFDPDKTGLITVISSTLMIRDLAIAPLEPREIFDYALQSYPFLIKNGLPAITQDSGKVAQRTAIGIDDAQNIYIFSYLDSTISLYDFMEAIVSLKLPVTQVLNLDGGPSSGLVGNYGGIEYGFDSVVPVSSVFRIYPK